MELQNREKSGLLSGRGRTAAITIAGVGLMLCAAVIGHASAGERDTYGETRDYQSQTADYSGNTHDKVVEFSPGNAQANEAHAGYNQQQGSDAEVYAYEDGYYIEDVQDDYYVDDNVDGDTDVWVNGIELSWAEVYAVEAQIGVVVMPGDYWLDNQGNYGFSGAPAMGNLYSPQANYGGGQNGGGSGGGMDSTMFGSVGGGNFYDSSTGCSYMPGSGVSC